MGNNNFLQGICKKPTDFITREIKIHINYETNTLEIIHDKKVIGESPINEQLVILLSDDYGGSKQVFLCQGDSLSMTFKEQLKEEANEEGVQ